MQGGTSILDLLSLITSRVASKSVSGNLTRTAMETLGKGWEIGCTLEFDAQRAEHSLKWFDGEAIPKVLPPPAHVFEVAFRSDLQAVQDLHCTNHIRQQPAGEQPSSHRPQQGEFSGSREGATQDIVAVRDHPLGAAPVAAAIPVETC